jgi:hypothetical protein
VVGWEKDVADIGSVTGLLHSVYAGSDWVRIPSVVSFFHLCHAYYTGELTSMKYCFFGWFSPIAVIFMRKPS